MSDPTVSRSEWSGKDEALRLIAATEHVVEPPSVQNLLLEAQVYATLHLAEKVEGVAMVLDYIDSKIAGSGR